MSDTVRVRFAPSPTGGLHLGGIRTVLYNYLFAKQNNGKFIVRIEDTDKTRFVAGAEEYIFSCLKWIGLEPDESPIHGGNYGPYRQSERKEIYKKYAEQLIKDGFAYYAFDTPAELEKMRHDFKTEHNPSQQYDHNVRMKMCNSLTLSAAEINKLLSSKEVKSVIRIKMPEKKIVSFTDLIRGEISFDTSVVDDKVLLKADGMPTYHLAVVVDDYLMKITHAFRGEEWLPSAPVHVLLWKYLFGLDQMPQWAHLPLILGSSGKLSKRDGLKYGFPVLAMNWLDPKTGLTAIGFKEKGFVPEAFINLLALLGWNDGTEQELFTKEELIEKFSIDRIHAAGAKFDYEKAKWFNHEWLKRANLDDLKQKVKEVFLSNQIEITNDALLINVIELVKDRCTLLDDFYEQSLFFFKTPEQFDTESILSKWDESKKEFFIDWQIQLMNLPTWTSSALESNFKELAQEKNIKQGDLLLPLRIMLVGRKFGPPVFQIAELLEKKETISRIKTVLANLNS